MQIHQTLKFGALALIVGATSGFADITGVTYSVNNSTRTHVYTRGTAITPDTATTVGDMAAAPGGCGTMPALPAGLTMTQLSTTQCVITGTPTVTVPTKIYEVHFVAASGADSLTFLTLTVGPVTNLSYGTKIITGTVGKVLTAVTPTLGLQTGTMVYTADSALPTGLTLASATGIIAGTPTAEFSGRTYLITATNGTDTTRASVRIEAKAAVSYSTWSGHKLITVNPAGLNLGAPVTNFPVLVRLSGGNSDVFAASKTGADVRFTATDSVTPLTFQIEQWDSIAKQAEIWVNVPVVSNTSNTTFIMHYGKAGQTSASNGAAAFSRANNFQAVWHMSAAAASVENDATSNGYNATPTGTSSISGVIGKARAFDGASYLTATGTATGALNFPQNSAWSIAAWVTSSATQRLTVLSKSNTQYALQTAYSRTEWETVEFSNIMQPGTETVIRGGWAHAFSPADSVKPAGSWTHVVGVSNAGALYTYVNGNLVGSSLQGYDWNANGTTARTEGQDVVIGAMDENGLGRFWDSNIDEIQMSDVARDSNWIRLSYATQRGTNPVVSVAGTVLLVPDAPTGVTAVNAATAGSIIVTWVAPASNGGAAISKYKAYAVSDSSKFCEATTGVTCTISGLKVDSSYTFKVTATNSVGTSVASAASASVTGIRSGVAHSTSGFSASRQNGAITFALPSGSRSGRLMVSDIRGRQVWSMNVNGNVATWNGVLANGKPMNQGTYLVRFVNQDSKTWETKLAYTR